MDAFIRNIIRLAFEEDCPNQDVTSNICLDKNTFGKAYFLSKATGIFCGEKFIPILVDEYKYFCKEAKLQILDLPKDREDLFINKKFGLLEGRLIDLLVIERTLLNFIQRLCGIATITYKYVEVAGKNKILDTRKSIPGHRYLDKYAARIGGATNHRMSLSDQILVKNNHIDALDRDYLKLGRNLSEKNKNNLKVEIEVRNLNELIEVLNSCSMDVIMLDNFNDSDTFEAVKIIRDRNSNIDIELSGSMNIERITALSRSLEGVYISVGSIFTKVQNLDISFRIEI
jgi:nicotinate-nucleotide pyrophosphorylase (carboxylating)